MAKRMLIDAAHSEETRVVVINGNRLEEFDFETSTKKQIKGNIYLAKVTRVEPSLQAAFVDFGGNRHGFLAFSEIHPDYFRIPVSDRDEEIRGGRQARRAERSREARVSSDPEDLPELPQFESEPTAEREQPAFAAAETETAEPDAAGPETVEPVESIDATPESAETASTPVPAEPPVADEPHLSAWESEPVSAVQPEVEVPEAAPAEAGFPAVEEASAERDAAEAAQQPEALHGEVEPPPHPETVETMGVDSEIEEERRERARRFRHYKIQEVIKRRQIMLVLVTKEERGNKGAALTTYLSLAGRYCVLMPNTPRGGGVSRKITSAQDRRRLKELVEDLDMPEGMGVIVRTAGSERTKPEIKRDFDYLIRLWNEIRDHTLQSTAPALIYEEGNLIKRSIRDLYQRDIEEVLVEGEDGYRTAKAFMKMLMPSHAKRVQPYRDPVIPLLQRFQIESQIDGIHSPTVQLRSGGYIVINQTEALVAIDVNSGRSTRERNIEETALRTNLEAADEVARQLRLRDLAGLIVIDFIDMEEHRNQVAVERRLKEAMKHDRARIQIGRISAFGLLELSRQRLRPSLAEASTQPCPHCSGTGFIRSTESTALHVLRAIEEEGVRRRSAEIAITVPPHVALYILNQKRDTLLQIEGRYRCRVRVDADEELIPPAFRLERLRAFTPAELAAIPTQVTPLPAPEPDEDELEEETALEEASSEGAAELRGEGEGDAERRRRRRRRRRGRRDEEHAAPREPDQAAAQPASGEEPEMEEDEAESEMESEPAEAEAMEGDGEAPRDATSTEAAEGDHRRRRRGRRGGRRRRREGEGAETRPAASVDRESAHPAATEIEIIEMAPPASAPEQPLAEAFDAPTLDTHAEQPSPELAPEAGTAFPGEAQAERLPEEPEEIRTEEPVAAVETAVPAEAAEEPARSDLPEPKLVTERPVNPRRGWWSRG